VVRLPTNLAIDDDLLTEALRVGGRTTKRETVNEALREFIARRRRIRAVEAFGTFDFGVGFDYKAARKRK